MENETSVQHARGEMQTEKSSEKKSDDLDSVLIEVGEFGKYQIFHFFLLSMVIVLTAVTAVDYIVTASTLDYRYENVSIFICNCCTIIT